MVSQDLSVGEVSQRSGVAISALHFYERKGLISSLRTSGNQRRYSRDVLRRLAVIRVAQRVGMPLEAVGRAFESLPEGRAPTKSDWAKLSARWRTELEERIHMLQLLRDGTHRLHRLWLPVAAALPPGQPGGRPRRTRRRPDALGMTHGKGPGSG